LHRPCGLICLADKTLLAEIMPGVGKSGHEQGQAQFDEIHVSALRRHYPEMDIETADALGGVG
jgi:hypothetical protein